MNVKKYSKFIAAFVGFVAVLGQVAADGSIDSAEAGILLTAAVSAAAVFQVKNRPPA